MKQGNILHSYLLRPVLHYTALIALIAGIILAAFYLRGLFALGIEKQVPASLLFAAFLYTQLAQLGFTLMLAQMPAAVLGLASHHLHNEITALRAAGMSYAAIARPFLTLAVVMLAVGLLLHQLVTPWARGNFRELRSFIETYAPLDLAADGNNAFALTGRGNRTRHVRFDSRQFDSRLRTHVFRGVEIIETETFGNVRVMRQLITADTGFAVNKRDEKNLIWRYLRLVQGYMVDFAPGLGYDSRVVSFQKGSMDILLAAPQEAGTSEERAKDSLFPNQLWQRRAQLFASKNTGAGSRGDALDYDHEFHQRLALPVALPLIVMTGFLLSMLAGMRWRWHAVGVSAFLAGAYYALFLLAKIVAVNGGLIPVWCAAWLPNLALLGLIGASVFFVTRR